MEINTKLTEEVSKVVHNLVGTSIDPVVSTNSVGVIFISLDSITLIVNRKGECITSGISEDMRVLKLIDNKELILNSVGISLNQDFDRKYKSVRDIHFAKLEEVKETMKEHNHGV